MSKNKKELPPDEPGSLSEWLWRVKQYENSIYVRELVKGHWDTVSLGSLPPKEWSAHVARMLELGILPTRVREEGEK